jgi:hypothetical protein
MESSLINQERNMQADPFELGVKHNIPLKVLLIRDDHMICAMADQKTGQYTHKFTVPIPATLKHVELTEPVEGIQVVAQHTSKHRAPKGETKIDKCTSYFKANPGLTKEQYIEAFVSQFGCTPQGANTYFHTCRKL